jgi:diacylglycerol kinase (ATP)
VATCVITAMSMHTPYKGRTGIKRMWNALFYSLDGFTSAFKHEEAFRLEVLLALILIPLSLSMHTSGISKALMIGSVLLVLIIELINAAIEAITDRVSLESHVLAKRAKDCGSAAVMLSLINMVVIWVLVLVGASGLMLE